MALSAFLPGPAGNVAVGPTPLSVTVAGPTILITNLGEAVVYGTLSANGTAGILGWTPIAAISGTSIGATGGFAIPPNQSVPISIGAANAVWLATGGSLSSGVNIVNGT